MPPTICSHCRYFMNACLWPEHLFMKILTLVNSNRKKGARQLSDLALPSLKKKQQTHGEKDYDRNYFNSLHPALCLCSRKQTIWLWKIRYADWSISHACILQRLCTLACTCCWTYHCSLSYNSQVKTLWVLCSLFNNDNVHGIHHCHIAVQHIHTLFMWWYSRKTRMDRALGLQCCIHWSCFDRNYHRGKKQVFNINPGPNSLKNYHERIKSILQNIDLLHSKHSLGNQHVFRIWLNGTPPQSVHKAIPTSCATSGRYIRCSI